MTALASHRSRLGDAGLLALLLALAAVAWAITAGRMAGMDTGPGAELGDLGWFALTWLVMMVAMMLPAAAPMAVAYGRRQIPEAVGLFLAGYLLVWSAAGLLGYAAIEAVRSLELGFLGWEQAGRYVAAAVIAGAGLYQLTTAKHACLRRCRDRGAFLGERRRTGRLGALRTGIEHGGFCVGCCWALMAALFALGAMSLAWMAVLAVLIAAERLPPWDRAPRRAVAVVLVALGITVAVAPGDVPGLTVPGGAMEMG